MIMRLSVINSNVAVALVFTFVDNGLKIQVAEKSLTNDICWRNENSQLAGPRS